MLSSDKASMQNSTSKLPGIVSRTWEVIVGPQRGPAPRLRTAVDSRQILKRIRHHFTSQFSRPWCFTSLFFDDVSVFRSQKNDSFDQPEWLVPETANVHSCHLRSAEYLEKSIFVNKRKVLSALRSLISSFEGDNTLPKLHIRAPYTLISAWRYCWRRILIYFSKEDLVVHHVRLVQNNPDLVIMPV